MATVEKEKSTQNVTLSKTWTQATEPVQGHSHRDFRCQSQVAFLMEAWVVRANVVEYNECSLMKFTAFTSLTETLIPVRWSTRSISVNAPKAINPWCVVTSEHILFSLCKCKSAQGHTSSADIPSPTTVLQGTKDFIDFWFNSLVWTSTIWIST